MNAGEQFAQAEGLRHVIIRAEFEADDLVDLLAFGGEHQDRHAALSRTDFPAQIVTAFPRQHDVEDHEIGLTLTEHRSGLEAVATLADFVALAPQRVAQTETDVGVVFNYKEVSFHKVGAPGS